MVDHIQTSDGLRLTVSEHGDPQAPTVLAVHGYPDDHHVWDAVVADLATDHHVVTYDVRGAGASQAPAGRAGYDLDRLVADLVAVADATGPDRPVHLLGHDWGAIALWHAVTDPALRARFASATAISGPCLDHVGAWYRTAPLAARLRQSRRSWYIAAIRIPVLPELAIRAGLLDRALARESHRPASRRTALNGLQLYRANMAARVGDPADRRTTVPVQLLVPTGDAYVTPAMATGVGDRAAELRVRPVPGGHWLPRTRPDVVARSVRELVAHVEGGGDVRVDRAMRRSLTVSGRWEQRVVVVTGAGSGIGRETALAFARRGAHVVGADVDGEAAEKTAASTGGAAYRVDVADAAAMAAFAEAVAAAHGVPDVVVNNAGIGMAGPFTATTEDEWRRIVDVNLWGVVHGCRVFVPLLRARGEGGHVVNVASAAAFLPHRSLSAYATTKAAVLALSQSLRAELAEEDIGVTAVCPGFVHTNITATARFAGLSAEAERRSRQEATAAYARRGYTPDRVAERLVRAVERDLAVAPVTAEAHAGLLTSRLAPGLVRALLRREL